MYPYYVTYVQVHFELVDVIRGRIETLELDLKINFIITFSKRIEFKKMSKKPQVLDNKSKLIRIVNYPA